MIASAHPDPPPLSLVLPPPTGGRLPRLGQDLASLHRGLDCIFHEPGVNRCEVHWEHPAQDITGGNMESERDMYRQFQDWCLRTYGDSGKTKTVTRKKYERIVQLLNGSESSSTDNAKFKFWVKSKGFQLGQPDEVRGGGGGAKQVLFVRVKTTVSSLLLFVCWSSPEGRAERGEGREMLEPLLAPSPHPLLNPLPSLP